MIRESTSSQIPPRNADVTPTSTESTVAITPTSERQLKRQPDAGQHLGQDVLPGLRGAEPGAAPDGAASVRGVWSARVVRLRPSGR